MKFLPSLIVPKDQLKWFPWTEYLACTNVKVAAKVKADAAPGTMVLELCVGKYLDLLLA